MPRGTRRQDEQVTDEQSDDVESMGESETPDDADDTPAHQSNGPQIGDTVICTNRLPSPIRPWEHPIWIGVIEQPGTDPSRWSGKYSEAAFCKFKQAPPSPLPQPRRPDRYVHSARQGGLADRPHAAGGQPHRVGGHPPLPRRGRCSPVSAARLEAGRGLEVSSAEISDNLHVLIELKERLAELQRDLDQQFQPAALRLYGLNLPGGEELRDQMQVFGSYLESLLEILTGVTYAGPNEGAFLYWEFEVKDGRNEEQAIAAMHEAFSGQELEDCLTLYRTHKAKLPTLPESEKPTLRLHRPDEDERS